MLHTIPATVLPSDPSESRWHYLYLTAAIGALLTVALFFFQIIAFFVWPPPSTVTGHFALLHARPFVGLVSLDFLIIVDEVLAIPLCLALYFSLRRVHQSLVLIATGLAAASIVCFLVATPALSMQYLSKQYAVATTAVEREQFLAAGQAVLSSWFGTPFQVGYVLGSIDMILIGWVMLRSRIFGKATGYVGIVASVVGLGVYVPKVGVYISILSVVGMQAWYMMTALTLLRLSKRTS